MAMNFSTGLINYVMDTGSFKQAFTNCHMTFYAGARPASADDAPTGTVLGEGTLNGDPFTEGAATNGLNFDDAVLKTISKAAAETWKITCTANGTIGWFRIKANAVDANGVSTTAIRADGVVGITNGDARLTSLTAVAGEKITISACSFTGT